MNTCYVTCAMLETEITEAKSNISCPHDASMRLGEGGTD